jgi:hypothetical protein
LSVASCSRQRKHCWSLASIPLWRWTNAIISFSLAGAANRDEGWTVRVRGHQRQVVMNSSNLFGELPRIKMKWKLFSSGLARQI